MCERNDCKRFCVPQYARCKAHLREDRGFRLLRCDASQVRDILNTDRDIQTVSSCWHPTAPVTLAGRIIVFKACSLIVRGCRFDQILTRWARGHDHNKRFPPTLVVIPVSAGIAPEYLTHFSSGMNRTDSRESDMALDDSDSEPDC